MKVESIIAASAGRIGHLEFRIISRLPIATYLAHP